MAIVLISFSGHAQTTDRTESAEIVIKFSGSNSSYKFTSIKDFDANADKLFAEGVASAMETSRPDACTITISMTVSVTANASVGVAGGSVTTTVSGSITVSCASAVAAAKKLRAQLIAIAQG